MVRGLPLPTLPLQGRGKGPARTALRASSWHPVVVPEGELDEGLPGRRGPSSSCAGEVVPRRVVPYPGRVAGTAPRSTIRRLMNAPPRERGSGQYGGGGKGGDKWRVYPRDRINRS